ncbi:MAG: HlyD family efflux transporter periplasmic adaptor subunit [Kouleothrix sp.]
MAGIHAAELQVEQAQALVDKINSKRPTAPRAAAAHRPAWPRPARPRHGLTAAPRDAQKAAAVLAWRRPRPCSSWRRSNCEHAEIRAPFDGIVAAVNIDPGDLSTVVGQAAIKVVDVSKLHVDVRIADIDVAKVAVGQAVAARRRNARQNLYRQGHVCVADRHHSRHHPHLPGAHRDRRSGGCAPVSARADITSK